jgi:ADP-dependent NAD(P)H-hydrate dehydratase / NAD(P)H-hydrate epimerase
VPSIPILATAEVRALEARAAGRTPALMDLAGQATALAARRLAEDTGAPILVVAGPGNNGGDAWVAAARLRESFSRVVVLDAAGTPPKAAEARAARERFEAAGGEITREWPVRHPSLVVDGLLGIGLSRDVDAPMAALILRINESGAPVLAIDVPSGLDADTGRALGCAVRASHTLTFIARKPGLHMLDGLEHCGEVECDDLGLRDEALAAAKGGLLAPAAVRGWLAPRARDSHKGHYGSLGIIGGNRGMVGAALLAARAGLFAGAGKVFVGLLSPDAPGVDPVHPELMMRPVDDVLSADVIVAGPGAGQSPSATSVSMFERSLMPALIALAKPLVLDADALNAVAFSDTLREDLAARRKGPTILTPHPAEAARLLGIDTAQVQADRLSAALEIARRFGAHVVLKGAGSVCAFPDGRWSINSTGNPGLASGGTGDVLAGMIGALLCQGLSAEQALQYAVCLHGAAADALVARGEGPIGLSASELMLEARRLMNAWTGVGLI